MVLGGCSSGGAAVDPAGTERAEVLGGTSSGVEDDGVVHVRSTSTTNVQRRCSGTLIAKNVVATAQHCVSDFKDGLFTCSPEGELMSSSGQGEMGMLLAPSAIEIRLGESVDVNEAPAAVGSRIFAPPATTICRNDIALVVLDRDIDGVEPFPVRLTSSVEPGDVIRVAGYGLDDTMTAVGVRRTRAGVSILQVGDNAFRPDGEAVAPRTFNTASVLCPGDSGGPAFGESGALVGIFSLVVGSTCAASRARNVFTQTSPFAADIVGPAFDAAGATPIPEPGEGVGGSAGSTSTSGGESGEGEAGEGGSPGTGGSSGTGGSGGAAGAAARGGTAGADGGAGATGNAGDAGAATAPRGLRQRGGCRCDVPGVAGTGHQSLSWVGAALLALTWARRRKRPVDVGSV